jgi:CRP-like cAMP-binding protein
MSDAQLERLAGFVELRKVSQWTTIVREGELGDAMFLILEGEFRVRTHAAGRETVLATLGIGDFFGDMCLLDRGLRSADVIANTDGVLARISHSSFQHVADEAPDLAAPLALAMGRTLSARIRKADKRLTDSLKLACAVA